MNLAAMVLSTALCGGMTFFFYRKRQHAAAANSAASFTKWVRMRHGSFLVLWILVAVYLYLAPDSSGVMLAIWWGCLILGIVSDAIQFSRTFSPRLMETQLQKEQSGD